VKSVKFALAELRISAVHLVFQDRSNPSIDIVSEYLKSQDIPFTLQSSTVFDDLVTLLSARHIVVGYGTFCEAVGLLSERIQTYIGFRTLSTQPIKFWGQSRVDELLRAKGVRTLVIEDWDHSYIAPGTWCNTPDQIDLIRTYPEAKLCYQDWRGSPESC
jgi:hypothetical protein